MAELETQFVAFAGHRLIARGGLSEVALQCKHRLESGEMARIAVYEDATGRVRDLELMGNEEEVLARLKPKTAEGSTTPSPPRARGRGRPRLGVISREISLLPRHWDWLREQPGGASATLRKLVEVARKSESKEAITRRAIEATHRFLWDIGGDLPGFEEASRTLFKADFDAFQEQIHSWPMDLRDQVARYLGRGT